jgi:NAD(P)-dependent dehydrogenase (short-subunit alcohol dehydrogenase family)
LTSPQRIIDQTLQRFGRIDVLVNNAAAAPVAPLEQTEETLLRQTFEVNVFGPALLIARIWPVFVRQRGGCVVNVSSIATVDPFAGLGVYASSKAALESLGRSTHVEGREDNIRAFNIAPGAVETPMLRSAFSTEIIPRERTLDPMNVAAVIADCVLGRRDDQMGKTILLPSP